MVTIRSVPEKTPAMSARRLSTVLTAAVILLTAFFAVPLPASAVTTNQPTGIASLNQTPQLPLSLALRKAADWVARDFTTNCLNGANNSYDCTNGGLEDAIMALHAASPDIYAATITQMLNHLQPQIPAYTHANPAGTAKSIITASTAGADPTNFGGINLVAQLTADLAAKPAAGIWGPALSIIALHRVGQAVPVSIFDALVARQDPLSGGFGWKTYTGAWYTDGDDTAVGLMALYTGANTDSAYKVAFRKAYAWALSPGYRTIDSTGSYWTSACPVNTNGMMLAAIGDIKDTTFWYQAEMTWLEGQQLPTGAFASALNGTTDDAMATTQAILGLALKGYLMN